MTLNSDLSELQANLGLPYTTNDMSAPAFKSFTDEMPNTQRWLQPEKIATDVSKKMKSPAQPTLTSDSSIASWDNNSRSAVPLETIKDRRKQP